MTLVGERLFNFFVAQQPPVGRGLLTVEALRSHSDTPRSVELLWTSDQSVVETSTWQHTTLTRDRHPSPPAELEPAIPASERPQNHSLDRVATRTPNYSVNNLSQLHSDTTNVDLAELGSNPTLRGEAPATELINGRGLSEECKTLDRTSQRTHRVSGYDVKCD
jgi:hypothetical protein